MSVWWMHLRLLCCRLDTRSLQFVSYAFRIRSHYMALTVTDMAAEKIAADIIQGA